VIASMLGGGQRQRVGMVARLAGQALDVLAHLVQRDDWDEEQGEAPPASAQPVLPVTAAPPAVKDALPDRPVEDPQSPDDQQPSSLRHRR
jgi:hypothetical protein